MPSTPPPNVPRVESPHALLALLASAPPTTVLAAAEMLGPCQVAMDLLSVCRQLRENFKL